MAVRKLSREQWAYEISRAQKVRDVQREKLRQTKFQYYEHVVSRLMPLPYLIGGTAIILLIVLYGWGVFFEFFLSWCVSFTLVATAAYYLWKHYEKEL